MAVRARFFGNPKCTALERGVGGLLRACDDSSDGESSRSERGENRFAVPATGFAVKPGFRCGATALSDRHTEVAARDGASRGVPIPRGREAATDRPGGLEQNFLSEVVCFCPFVMSVAACVSATNRRFPISFSPR